MYNDSRVDFWEVLVHKLPILEPPTLSNKLSKLSKINSLQNWLYSTTLESCFWVFAFENFVGAYVPTALKCCCWDCSRTMESCSWEFLLCIRANDSRELIWEFLVHMCLLELPTLSNKLSKFSKVSSPHNWLCTMTSQLTFKKIWSMNPPSSSPHSFTTCQNSQKSARHKIDYIQRLQRVAFEKFCCNRASSSSPLSLTSCRSSQESAHFKIDYVQCL